MWDAVADGLRRRGFDVVLAREVGLAEADDPAQLAYAAAAVRVTVTFDTDYPGLHRAGVSHAGIAWFKLGRRSIGDMIDLLEILALTSTLEQMRDRLEYL
jgi:predicted nuclease of predicted toxin-antitoxin system